MPRLSILLLALLSPSLVVAQPKTATIFDAIPKEASAAIVLRSIDDFKVKGGQLLKDLELKVEYTPEKLVEEIYKFLGIQGGVDEKAPVVLTILRREGGNADLEEIVLMLPIGDRAKLLGSFDLKAGEPKGDAVVPIDRNGFLSPKVLTIRGRHLCLGFSEKTLQRLTTGSLEGVSAAEKKQFGDADLLLYLGERAWPLVWGNYLGALENYFNARRDGEEKAVGNKFVQGLRATQRSFIGVRLHEGVRLRFNMVFDTEKSRAAREMLALLRVGTNRSDLKGLPTGRAVAGLGWAGDGSKNGILTKLLFDVFLEGPLPSYFNNLPVFATTDYPTVVGITHELWQRLKGSRLGLYHNENEKELGLFSALAILDAADAGEMLKEVRTLARIADLKEADLKTPEGKKLIDVEQLVRDLDDAKYRVRESASTKLLLLGEPTLPYLKKVIDTSGSLEHVRRAELLKKRIDEVAALRRKELLLPKELPRAIRPTFGYAPAVEKRQGVPVDVLRITLNIKAPEFEKQLQQLLGPNWDKLRLAVVGNQIVVLLGSDVALFDQALANLKGGKDGLAAGKLLAGFERRADKERTTEMHGSAQAFLGLLAPQWKLPAKLFRDAPELTSFAATFAADRLHFDLWAPNRELRAMVGTIFPRQE